MSVRGFSRTLNNGALLVVIAVLSTGCAATRPTTELPELTDWDTRQAVLAGAEQWYLKGRIGVRTADDGFNAKLRWTQDRSRFEQSVTLTDKDGVETRLQDAEPELYLRYGWTIPVGSLPYWLLGIPDPQRPARTEIDAEGRLTRLEQGGWDVSFTRYDGGVGQELPGRITASSSTTRVRIVIDNRQFYALN